jgi:hypothetical protein
MDKRIFEIVDRVLGLLRPGLRLPKTVQSVEQLDAAVKLIAELLGATEDTSDGSDMPDLAENSAVAMSLKSLKAEIARTRGQVKRLRGSQGDEWITLHRTGLMTPEAIIRQSQRLGGR